MDAVEKQQQCNEIESGSQSKILTFLKYYHRCDGQMYTHFSYVNDVFLELLTSIL